jgi:hypothetical protein
MKSRQELFDELVNELGGPEALQMGQTKPDLSTPEAKWLLIERNFRGGRGYWLTVCHSPEEAGNAYVSQEYQEDWEPIWLIDLDTGHRSVPQLRLEWIS